PDVMMQMSARVREKAMALPVVEAPAGFSKDDEEPIELE
ncbi:MAG: hypothetical protein RIR87_1693, partial [Actinomycetota bacterium]